jgi:hypothetical protein
MMISYPLDLIEQVQEYSAFTEDKRRMNGGKAADMRLRGNDRHYFVSFAFRPFEGWSLFCIFLLTKPFFPLT